ncbi:hypothetical protein AK812_SmicGene8827 [Symbiodinium microadriaticum]|uniref:Uncharacterized protein n=1 Tax=Symbiodinium microadriaticum TaxID=2951 RepID=A0A1Q9EJX5_SYMMI|nr:hypothetical protein AK812_SmicGene8827 [Symbiodinium microadriaticum]
MRSIANAGERLESEGLIIASRLYRHLASAHDIASRDSSEGIKAISFQCHNQDTNSFPTAPEGVGGNGLVFTLISWNGSSFGGFAAQYKRLHCSAQSFALGLTGREEREVAQRLCSALRAPALCPAPAPRGTRARTALPGETKDEGCLAGRASSVVAAIAAGTGRLSNQGRDEPSRQLQRQLYITAKRYVLQVGRPLVLLLVQLLLSGWPLLPLLTRLHSEVDRKML